MFEGYRTECYHPLMGNLTDTEQLRRRNRELLILNAIAQGLNQENDLTRAMDVVLAQVTELLDLDTGWIWLLDEESAQPYLAASQSLPPSLADYPLRMQGSCYCLDIYLAGDMSGAANVDVVICTRLKGLVDGTDGLQYHASIPLYAHGKEMGVLNVATTGWRELSPEELRILYTVGDLLGIAVERARLFARSAEVGAAQERNRLAREIHDTLAQSLAALTLKLEVADALLESGIQPERAHQSVQEALDLTRNSLDEARRSVLDLRAAPLEGQSLPEALAALAWEHVTRYDRPVDFEVLGTERRLPVRVAVGLYRIAQEALNNVAQHSQARHVALMLYYGIDAVSLSVDDDGAGFNHNAIPSADASGGHFGLVGLNERARLLGGKLKVETASGEGTFIRAIVPVEVM